MRLSLGLGFTAAGILKTAAALIIPPTETLRHTSSFNTRNTSTGEIRKVS